MVSGSCGIIEYEWRGNFVDHELQALHAAAFAHAPVQRSWWAQVSRHSLGWVCARRDEQLAGFVNVAWDGGVHAFLLDTAVAPAVQRHGVGTRLVTFAADQARAAGCQWLHVDFEAHLRRFYLDSCGFTETSAGVLAN